MSLTLWNKREPVSGGPMRLRDELGRTLDRFFNEPMGWIEPKGMRAESWIPPLDMSETDAEVTIRIEAPGVPAKDLDISVAGNTLSIAGKKEEYQEKQGENFYSSERCFGSFRRLIDLPPTADSDKVTAESDNGLVTIHIAKKPGARAKQVEVKPVGKKVAIGA